MQELLSALFPEQVHLIEQSDVAHLGRAGGKREQTEQEHIPTKRVREVSDIQPWLQSHDVSNN